MDNFKKKLSIDFGQIANIRNAIVKALQSHEIPFFKDYTVSITIEGKVNENGVSAVFTMDKSEIEKEHIAEQNKGNGLIDKINKKIQKKINAIEKNYRMLSSLSELSISMGVSIPLLVKYAVTIRFIRKE